MAVQTSNGVRFEFRDLGLAEVVRRFRELDVVSLRVGAVGPKAQQRTADGRLTNAENLVIQMFGLAGPPGAPARDPFQVFTRHTPMVASIFRRICSNVIRLQETPMQAIDRAGYQLVKMSTDSILDKRIGPPNAKATVDTKGFDHPLVDSGGLVDAISHQTVRSGGGLLDAGSSAGDYQTFEVGGGE